MVEKVEKVEKKEVKQEDIVRTLGRRKTSTARVQLVLGKGEVMVNGKTLIGYFKIKYWMDKVLSPLIAVGKEKSFDISIKVNGGGITSQAEAVRHGIARALEKWNKDFRAILKAEGFLTRDSRAKERKKFGLHRARRGHQWRKR
ncbi:MAG: 30S ribosomal protein S9 [Candidatus Magasanikbacteria bacterium]|nr:30S ribosomal protein S9 [Candidatus Magasanikbacteria bacterium]